MILDLLLASMFTYKTYTAMPRKLYNFTFKTFRPKPTHLLNV